MKTLERILLLLGSIGILLTAITSYPISSIGLFSFTFLSIIYLIWSFSLFNNIKFRNCLKKESYSNISKKRIAFSIISGCILFFSIWLFLYKFQLWPGSRLTDYIGLFFIPIISVILIIHVFSYLKNKNKLDKLQIIRVSILLVIHATLTLTPRVTWAELRFSGHPNYIKAIKDFEKAPSYILEQNESSERDKVFN